MKNYISSICLLALLCLTFFSCKKENNPTPQGNTNPFKGGKGGNHNVIIFTGHNGGALHSRVYLKYAANTMPADTTLYDDIQNTMVEPGVGPHAHFSYLKEGTYYFYCKVGAFTADTVLTIDSTSAESIDAILNLK